MKATVVGATTAKGTPVRVTLAKAVAAKPTVPVTVRIIALRIVAAGIIVIRIITVVCRRIVGEWVSKAAKEDEPIVEAAVVEPIAAKAPAAKVIIVNSSAKNT